MASQKTDLDDLVAAIGRLGGATRTIVGVAGAPGSGKSTLAEAVVARLNAAEAGSAAILPMDGFHYDDRVLHDMGRHARKGAPDTFDVGGLGHILKRLKRNEEATVAVPVFDRDLEISRGSARLIPRAVRRIVVEGNYLLLAQAPWCDLRPLFDITVMVEVPEPILRERLTARWRGYALSADAIAQKLDGNDLPNGALVAATSVEATYRLVQQ